MSAPKLYEVDFVARAYSSLPSASSGLSICPSISAAAMSVGNTECSCLTGNSALLLPLSNPLKKVGIVDWVRRLRRMSKETSKMITLDSMAIGAPMAAPSFELWWEEADRSEETTVADGSAELDSDNGSTSVGILVSAEDTSMTRFKDDISKA